MENKALPVALELEVPVELEVLEAVILIHWAVFVEVEAQAVLEAKLQSHSVVAEEDLEVVSVLLEVLVVLVMMDDQVDVHLALAVEL